MEEKDENLKNAELSAKMAVLQNTIREYQDKIKELGNKLYTCKYKGVEIYEFYDEFLLFYDDITIQMLFYE